jgi:Tfp pilus assembly protein PilF
LKIDEAAFGPDHPQVATIVNNLGGVLQALGDHAGAKAAHERALKIFRQFLPEGHPYIKVVEGNLRSLPPPP